jgi:hypothetical protein
VVAGLARRDGAFNLNQGYNKMNDDIFWHGISGAKQLRDMRLEDLARLMQHAQLYTPQQSPSADLQLKYLQGMGTPWPKMQRSELGGIDLDPIGQYGGRAVNLPEQTLAKPGEMIEAVGDMALRQAQQAGRVAGTQAGEKAVTEGGYQPQIIEQQKGMIDLYNEMLKNFGQDPAGWGTIEGVTGIEREAEEEEAWGPIQKHPSGYTYQVSEKTGQVKKIDRPPEGAGVGETEQDRLIKGAQQFVLKFANQSQNQMIQLMFAMNPDMAAKNPAMQAMLRDEVPEQFKPVFDQAIMILNQHYKAGAREMGILPEQQGGKDIQDFAIKHGIRIK